MRRDDARAVPCCAVLRTQMTSGEGLVHKGGDPEYRRTSEQYGLIFGRDPSGEWLTEEKRGEYGFGAYSDKPYCYATVEMYLAALGWFYDQVCSHCCGRARVRARVGARWVGGCSSERVCARRAAGQL